MKAKLWIALTRAGFTGKSSEKAYFGIDDADSLIKLLGKGRYEL